MQVKSTEGGPGLSLGRKLLLYAIQIYAVCVGLYALAMVVNVGDLRWAGALPLVVPTLAWTIDRLPKPTRKPLEYY
jgi:hypothetical protein